MDDVGMALVDWSEDVDDMIRCLSDSRTGGAGEAKSAASTITPGR